MNQTIRIRRGLDLVIAGMPAQAVGPANEVRSISLLGADYPGLVLKPLVEPGSRIAAGAALLADRHQPAVLVVSPVAGIVTAVARGPHRRVESVTIEIAAGNTAGPTIGVDGSLSVREMLLASGMWTALRTRPFGVIPPPEAVPEAIFVTAIDTNPLAVDPMAAIAGMEDAFARGVEALGSLTPRPVFVCQAPGPPLLADALPRTRTVCFAGGHPAGLPSTHIHQLAAIEPDRPVWHIAWQEVVAIGRLMATGTPGSERIVAIGGPGARRPRLVRTAIGAKLEDLLDGEVQDGVFRVVSGSPLHGREGGWLGRFDTQVAILDAARSRADVPFLTRLLGIGTKVPAPIMPIADLDRGAVAGVPAVPLLRALSVRDVEAASALGCLRLVEEDVALLSHVCASRADYGPMLRAILDDLAAGT